MPVKLNSVQLRRSVHAFRSIRLCWTDCRWAAANTVFRHTS